MAGLLDPVRLGAINCRNRIAMAPCTRCMSPGFHPTDAVVAYYERRAADGVGLLISEGTVICERGNGYPDVPGIFDEACIGAWHRVTERVHAAGGRIACQIWHVGAVAHPRTTGGVLPEGPSGVSPVGEIRRLRRPDGTHERYGESEAVSEERIFELVDLYRRAARNSITAGFDGVEIHGAHGYLIDQFNNLHFNRREDRWGGEHRTRFAHDVARAVIGEIGSERTIMRISPTKSAAGEPWVEPEATFRLLLHDLWEAGLRILHISNEDYDEAVLPASLLGRDASENITLHAAARALWPGQLIGVGQLTPERADRAIADGEIDMAAFGRALIANPDLVSRIRANKPLEAFTPEILETLV